LSWLLDDVITKSENLAKIYVTLSSCTFWPKKDV